MVYFSFLSIYFAIFCVHECLACMCLYITFIKCPQEAEEGVRPLELELLTVVSSHVVLRPKPDPFLQPRYLFIFLNFFFTYFTYQL